MSVTYEYLVKKMFQQKQKRKFMHKTRYGKELGEAWGYDKKGHQEAYNRLKNNPSQMVREYFVN